MAGILKMPNRRGLGENNAINVTNIYTREICGMSVTSNSSDL